MTILLARALLAVKTFVAEVMSTYSLQVSTFEMDEETALMEDQSGEESGEMSESEIDKKPADGEESDEELLNL